MNRLRTRRLNPSDALSATFSSLDEGGADRSGLTVVCVVAGVVILAVLAALIGIWRRRRQAEDEGEAQKE